MHIEMLLPESTCGIYEQDFHFVTINSHNLEEKQINVKFVYRI